MVSGHAEGEDVAGALEHQPPLKSGAALEPIGAQLLNANAAVQMRLAEQGGNGFNDGLRGGEVRAGELAKVF